MRRLRPLGWIALVISWWLSSSRAWADPAAAAPASVEPALLPCAGAPTLLPQVTKSCSQPPYAAPWLRAGRINLEVVMGAALGAIPEVAGAYAGLSIDVLNGREAGAGFAIGTTLGAALGVGSSVFLAGYLMGGDGSYGWSVLGSTVGAGVAAGILALNSTTTTLIFAAALPIVGAVIGYEFSSHGHRAVQLETTVAGVSIMPALGLTSLGLVASF